MSKSRSFEGNRQDAFPVKEGREVQKTGSFSWGRDGHPPGSKTLDH